MSTFTSHIKDGATSLWSRKALYAWRVFALGALAVVYANPLARGISNTFPEFGVKLSKTPFLGSLAKYEETKNLLVAHPFAMLFLIVVFVTWEIILRMACGEDSIFERFKKPEVAKRIMLSIGIAVLCTDCWFYYAGVTNSSWSGVAFSFSAILATIGFVAVNVAVTMFSVFLTPETIPQKESINA